MVVYADILILVNFAVDYFLLRSAAFAAKRTAPLWRMILSAFVSSLFSLYIFLPNAGIFSQLVFRAVCCAAVTLCAFGFKNAKSFFRALGWFLGVTLLYAGGMAAVYTLFRPSGMAVKNTVVYFNVSPLLLIFSSAAFYILLRLFEYVFQRPRGKSGECSVTLYLRGEKKRFSGLIDTGNRLRDPFGQSDVIIVNESDIKPLLPAAGDGVNERFCLLPCKTVTGAGLLRGIRLDSAAIETKKGAVTLLRPVAAFAAAPVEKDTAIINPDSIGA